MSVRTLHRTLVDAVAHRTGLTGKSLPNRSLHNRSPRFQNPGPRLNTYSASAAAAAHQPSRRRVLIGWQARIEAWLRGVRS